MGALQRQSLLAMTDPLIWLWICGLKEVEVQMSDYTHKPMFMDLYNIKYSNYWLVSNERLEDRAANNRLARGKVYLIFLIQKLYRASKKNPIVIPESFTALRTSVY
jgi:hypothetical protein